MKARALLALSVCALMAAAAFAAAPRRARSGAPPMAEETKWPGWVVSDAIPRFATHLRVKPARHYGDLTLFPVFAPEVRVPGVDLTLDKAVESGLVEIGELDAAEVNRVRVHNRAKAPLFLMAGEMLRGGQQDRIVGDDVIIPPRAKLTIPVFCVEHGRWTGRGGGFSAGRGRSVAGARMRAGGMAGGQSEVWSKVEKQQEALHAPSETGALRSVHESEDVRGQMKPYLGALADLPDDYPKASGVVAVVDGEILAADLFSSPALFRQLWPSLLDSYVIDALEHSADPDRPSVGHDRGGSRRDRRWHDPQAEEIERWLREVWRGRWTPKETPGAGALYELRGLDMVLWRGARDASALGSALVYEKGVVHMQLFPGPGAVEPQFNSLQFRRERLGQSDR